MLETIIGMMCFAFAWMLNPAFFVSPLTGDGGLDLFITSVIGAILPFVSKLINNSLKLSGVAKFITNFVLSILIGVGVTLYWYGFDFINSATAVAVILGVSTTVYNTLVKNIGTSTD